MAKNLFPRPLVAPTGWPPVGHEEVPWESIGPYQAAVSAAIAELPMPVLAPETWRLVSRASTEIVRFEGELDSDAAALSAMLLRSEAAASSKIDHLLAPAQAIALAGMGVVRGRAPALIANNATAVRQAIALAEQLDEDAIGRVHQALLGPAPWRAEPVWVGGGFGSPHRATFVPPHHGRVPAAMSDLVAYMAREDLEPLVQAAISHAQFETIHPYVEGNGRIGRALVLALLQGRNLTHNVVLPVSSGLLGDVGGYFTALTEYQQGRPDAIVRCVAEASLSAIGNGRRLISDVLAIRQRWRSRITARSDATAWRVTDQVFQQPVIDSPRLKSALGVPTMTADRAISALVEAGVLTKVSGNHRDRKYAAGEVLASLDAFARRAGRGRVT